MALFIENKYTRWYFNIVNSRPSRTKDYGCFELHHIIPRSLGGVNQKDNTILLTPKEHFIAHWLLTKMCIELEHKQKMLFALTCLRMNKSGHRIFTAGEYEILRRAHYESIKGVNHPSYGKPKSPETKAKMRAAAIGRKASDETRAKFSETHKGASNPMSKTWTLIDPNGAEHTITGKFQTFCDEHQILASALRWYRGKPVPPVATNTLGGFRSKSELSELKRQNTSGWCLY